MQPRLQSAPHPYILGRGQHVATEKYLGLNSGLVKLHHWKNIFGKQNRRRWILKQSLLRLGWWLVVFPNALSTWFPNPKIVEYRAFTIWYIIHNIYNNRIYRIYINPGLTEQMNKVYSPSCQIIRSGFWAVRTMCCLDDHLPRLLVCISIWLWHYSLKSIQSILGSTSLHVWGGDITALRMPRMRKETVRIIVLGITCSTVVHRGPAWFSHKTVFVTKSVFLTVLWSPGYTY